MAVVAFASAKGAPGVTTSVLALAFAWHRPALVVEADMAGSSSVLSGFLRGGTDHSHGARRPVRRGPPARLDRPGPLGRSACASVRSATCSPASPTPLRPPPDRRWSPLAGVLAGLEAAGVDVLVDAGRLGTAYAPMPLLRAADAVVLVTGTRLPDVYALSRRTAGAAQRTRRASGRREPVRPHRRRGTALHEPRDRGVAWASGW